MTRKKAIITIIVSGIGMLAGFLRFRWNRRYRRDSRSVEDYRELIDEISEIIIPRTDTPGAKDAQVSRYIINVIENCTSQQDRRKFLDGLDDVDNYCQARYSVPFMECHKQIKILVLEYFEAKSKFAHRILNKIRRKIWGQTFFENIKRLTVSGYCLSELGATKGLAYDAIPINYIACTPYSPNQRSWATR